jgi:hypothetical protein
MQNPPSVRDLYPALTEQELKEAEINLRRYAEIALAVFQEQLSVGFDTSFSSITMKERSNKSLKN